MTERRGIVHTVTGALIESTTLDLNLAIPHTREMTFNRDAIVKSQGALCWEGECEVKVNVFIIIVLPANQECGAISLHNLLIPRARGNKEEAGILVRLNILWFSYTWKILYHTSPAKLVCTVKLTPETE